jgi:hypothetical protein
MVVQIRVYADGDRCRRNHEEQQSCPRPSPAAPHHGRQHARGNSRLPVRHAPNVASGAAGEQRRACLAAASRRAPFPVSSERQEKAQATAKVVEMPNKRASVKNEKQYEKLKEKGMSKERAAKIANSPGASSRGGKKSGSASSRSSSRQGGTTAQKKAAGRKGGKAAARKS